MGPAAAAHVETEETDPKPDPAMIKEAMKQEMMKKMGPAAATQTQVDEEVDVPEDEEEVQLVNQEDECFPDDQEVEIEESDEWDLE